MERRLRFGSFLLVLFAATAASATTLVHMSLEELAAAADVVARVRCLENESRWEQGEIWTFTSFEVVETLKGPGPRLLTVRLLGGQVGHLVSTVAAVPRFRPGEEVFLFLERTPAGDFGVTSWVQGTFRIHREAPTGLESVTQDSSGLAVFDPATRKFRPAGIRNLPLETFKQKLAASLERHAGRRP